MPILMFCFSLVVSVHCINFQTTFIGMYILLAMDTSSIIEMFGFPMPILFNPVRSGLQSLDESSEAIRASEKI